MIGMMLIMTPQLLVDGMVLGYRGQTRLEMFPIFKASWILRQGGCYCEDHPSLWFIPSGNQTWQWKILYEWSCL